MAPSTNSASLVTLYGRGAVAFHDGKREYKASHGVLQVPQQLVQRALASGFSKTLPADMLEPALETPAATQTIDVPPEHPAAEQRAAAAAKDAKDAEKRAKAAAK